jgi:hypothetical protein
MKNTSAWDVGFPSCSQQPLASPYSLAAVNHRSIAVGAYWEQVLSPWRLFAA